MSRHVPSSLLAGALALVAAGLVAPPAASAAAATQPGGRTLTLVTGDQVTVPASASGTPEYRPGPGRERVGFLSWRRGDQLFVVPRDAAGPLAAGRLDEALFDVTGLLAEGHAGRTPSLIVEYQPSARAGRSTVVGAARTRSLPSVNADVLAPEAGSAWWDSFADHRGRLRAGAAGVKRVWLSHLRRPSLDVSVPQVGAPTAWKAGHTGKGVTVAVLDTGVKADHPDLKGRVAEARDFTGTRPDGSDDDGHGTHVAGTVAGDGTASGGRYKGVAPAATILSGRVCDIAGCADDAVIAGMEWAAGKAPVVNMSLGGAPSDGTDPLSRSLNTLTARTGTLFVVSAGNNGRDSSVGSPASADAALTVGSVTKSDQLSPFSSRGPRVRDYGLKPDIAAPGSDIVAARAPGTKHGDLAPVGDAYAGMSGTSMAAPHVAGGAALVLAAHPAWKGPQLKAALMASARSLPGISALAQGAGRLDLAQALGQAVTAEERSVSVYAKWPHREQVTRSLTLRNTAREAVTLELSAALTGPDAKPAPEGALALKDKKVTVPAGGTAKVGLTFDPTRMAIGQHAGFVTGTAGGQRISVPVAFHNETESYDLRAQVADTDNKPAADQLVALFGSDGKMAALEPTGQDGAAVLRAPKGGYQPFSMVYTGKGADATVTLIAPAPVTLDQDRNLPLNASAGRPAQLRTDRKVAAESNTAYHLGNGERSVAMVTAEALREVRVVPSPGVGPGFWLAASTDLLPATAEGAAPAWVDHVAAKLAAGRFTAPTLVDTAASTVPVRVRVHGSGQSGVERVNGALAEHGQFFKTAERHLTPASGERTERFTPGQAWTLVGRVAPKDAPEGLLEYRAERFAASRPATADLLAGVAGPHHKTGSRLGDEIKAGAGCDYLDPATMSLRFPCRGRLTLSSGGKELASGADQLRQVKVAPGAAEYRLQVQTRNTTSWLPFSTQVDTDWTFRSATTAGPRPTGLPLLIVGYHPKLDVAQAAPAGRRFSLPVSAFRADLQYTAQPKLRRLTVEVSYDAGATWTTAKLVRGGAGWVADLSHPAKAGSVSLRATAEDGDGNRVVQTILRAYATR